MGCVWESGVWEDGVWFCPPTRTASSPGGLTEQRMFNPIDQEFHTPIKIIQVAHNMFSVPMKVSHPISQSFEMEKLKKASSETGVPVKSVYRSMSRWSADVEVVDHDEIAEAAEAAEPIEAEEASVVRKLQRMADEESRSIGSWLGYVAKVDAQDLKDEVFAQRFAGMSWSLSRLIKEVIIEGMFERMSPEEMVGDIMSRAEVRRSDAERIVGTEVQNLQNKMKEMAFREADPEGNFKYRWVNPVDERTTDVCRRIVARTARGVVIEELKEIIQEEGKRGGFEPREFTPHVNCRSSLQVVL